ncbi:hypothetical protein IV203_036848 [Nitzschia inconspicua]|uniref:Uncharacterized protein n=1 Tax=Nitzschia inconspicua TaxID=303405 RepID=A0A9K3LGL3_9STRA|nr:hypothetical protein IV203_036848 [Nitzschia inconspicua]
MSLPNDNPDFPLESRVILHGLVNAPELNGKVGIIRSTLNDAGRQSVYLQDEKKTVGLKPTNLKYEPRSVDSLSVKELKLVLKAKGIDQVEYTGIDKIELRTKVSEHVTDEDEIPRLLAMGRAPVDSSASASVGAGVSVARTNTETASPAAAQAAHTTAAEQLSNMSPDALRQQARMMRSMDPNTIRSMNPQLANMTDEQIRMAADQMEMMANNPAMMKMAAEQMKNMNPEELQRMQSQMKNGQWTNGTTAPSAGFNAMGQGSFPNHGSNVPPMGADPAKLIANMDKEQLKQVLRTVKDNPEMLKQYAAMTGTTEEQLKQGMEAFAGMSDDKMEAALKMMQTVAQAKEKWNHVDAKTGGRLLHILVATAIFIIGLLVWYFFFSRGSSPISNVSEMVASSTEIPIVQEDEFSENEF